jgi:hypothetical protein
MSSGEYSFLAHTKAYTGLDVRSVAISCNEIYRREKATVMLTIPDLPGYQGLTHKKWLSQKMMCQFHLLVLDHMFGSGFHLPKPSSAKSLRKKRHPGAVLFIGGPGNCRSRRIVYRAPLSAQARI